VSCRDVDKRLVTVPEIRETGEYVAEIKLHPDVTARVRLNVYAKWDVQLLKLEWTVGVWGSLISPGELRCNQGSCPWELALRVVMVVVLGLHIQLLWFRAEILLKMPGVVVEKWRPGLVHPACKVNFQFVDFVEWKLEKFVNHSWFDRWSIPCMFIMAEEKWLQPLAKTVSSMNRPPKVDATIGFPGICFHLCSLYIYIFLSMRAALRILASYENLLLSIEFFLTHFP